jgi:hypothetical protein
MSEVVEWVLSLKDQFTHVLHGAKEKTEEFEETVDRTKEHAEGMLSSLGIGFAVFEGFEFVKKAKEDFEQLETAVSQVKAGLASTKGVAGLTFEDLENSAEEAAHKLKYTKGQIMDMQAIVLTFPSVTKKTFGAASDAMFDLATRMHKDLTSTAVEIGKALQDPIHGITALRKSGVNFNEAQTEMIKKMVAGGHAARAQAYILRELQTEVKGSAEAAAKADVAFRFNKSWEEIKLTVGELANNFLKKLAPALEWVATQFQNVTHWMKEHNEIMGAVEDILLPVIGVIGVIIVATKAWSAAQMLLNFQLINNPIGWITLAIAAFVGAIIWAYKHVDWFRAGLWGLWSVIKEVGSMVKDFFTGLYHVIHGTLFFSPSEIKEGLSSQVGAFQDAGKRLGDAWRVGYDSGMYDFDKDKLAEDRANDPNKDAKRGAGIGKGGPAEPTGPVSSAPGNRVSGQKIQTFNITIGSLIKEFSVNTTTLQDSLSRIKEAVARALTSAINDAQIVGDH